MISQTRARGWISALGLGAAVAWSGLQAACGDSAITPLPGDDGGLDAGWAPDVTTADDVPLLQNDANTGPVTSITIQPSAPIVDVTIDNGVVTTNPLTFTAISNFNQPVAASFALDRGELGALVASTGVFTASGNASGIGTVTATFGNLTAKTTVSVRMKMTQTGKPSSAPPPGGLGGNNGVGGNDFGAAVTLSIQSVLNGPATLPSTPAELGFLYPYDQTVWPRGITAPLLQWQSTHAAATQYVRVHLEQKLFSFDGYYAGPQYVNHPIDPVAWKKALLGNTGDALLASVYVSDGTTVWGPITESWKVAPGTLKGTVYYNSYNSKLTGAQNGALLAITPGALAPSIAIPGTQTSCHVCHEVSSDGSTLYTQDTTYADGASYNLNNKGATIATYTGNAPDSTSNNRKFLWSGIYPDGTFALSNARHAREHASINSNLFSRANGSAIASSGLTNAVTAAVTPAFSPDGKLVTFNFWEGPGAGGVAAGNGHSLVLMDFNCNAADGGKACGAPPYAFSNLREVYRDGARWPGWPGFLPDSSGIVFHNTVTPSTIAGDPELATWGGAQAEIWYTDTTTTPKALRMNLANGLDGGGNNYLPTNNLHGNDWKLNYEPTVNPVASGGYFWVVFTSRRMYGNVAAGDPFDNGNGSAPITKKLWVAAVDINGKPGVDPSHPAFYLPGQELTAGNLRGFWVVDPCRSDGTTCETGEECCGGFCRQDGDGGGLVCTTKPPQGCAQELEKCTSDNDCCGANQGIKCINGFCAKQGPN